MLDYLAAAQDGYLHPTWEEASVSYGAPTRVHAKGESLFLLPRALRAIGRSGLANCVDTDQCNAHPQAQLVRHPGRTALQKYVGERDVVLKDIKFESAKIFQIGWDNKTKDIETKYVSRTVQPTVDTKREVLPNYDTLPLGHQDTLN